MSTFSALVCVETEISFVFSLEFYRSNDCSMSIRTAVTLASTLNRFWLCLVLPDDSWRAFICSRPGSLAEFLLLESNDSFLGFLVARMKCVCQSADINDIIVLVGGSPAFRFF